MINAEAKLALTELLLGSVDASVCAQRGSSGSGGTSRPGGRCSPRPRATPAGCGASPRSASPRARTGEFVLDLDDRRDPLVAVAWSGRPAHFRRGPRQPETPLEGAPFHAVPLRPDRAAAAARHAPRSKATSPRSTTTSCWFAEVLGEKFQALRLRNVTADPGVDRERHLLYSIINSVTDPILLTDESGKLIIGNLRAEQLFAIRAGGERRPAPRRRDQQPVLLVGARRTPRRRRRCPRRAR